MFRPSVCLVFSAAILIVALPTATVLAQGSGSSRIPPSGSSKPATSEEFHQSLWKFLTTGKAPYKGWPSLVRRIAGADSPHGAKQAGFANSIAAGKLQELSHGSIIVREEFSQDGKQLLALNVMYRVKDYDPKNHDWYWLKYLPNGAIARTPAQEGNKPVAGRVASCIACHAKAQGNDHVFANDQSAKADER
jgi:hypothetical protein